MGLYGAPRGPRGSGAAAFSRPHGSGSAAARSAARRLRVGPPERAGRGSGPYGRPGARRGRKGRRTVPTPS
ncbi:hypothetical protein GCM10010282_73530 [Streptomyces roseolus]|nr:hypothetical protein GCM10010282_73530 [Streptomyces roseolus]